MNGYDLVRSQPSHDEMASKVKDFFDNGGKVNGSVEVDSIKNKTTVSTGGKTKTLYSGNINNIDPTFGMEIIDDKSGYDTKVELAQPGNPTTGGQGYFGSSYDLLTNLGSDIRRWKDVWVGNFSKTESGFTPVSNGFILQWGTFLSGGINVNNEITPTITLPIAFPTRIAVVVPFVKQCLTDGGTPIHAEVIIKRVIHYTSGTFSVRLKAKEYVSGGVEVGYLAVGY